MKTLALSGLVMTAVLFSVNIYSKDNSAATVATQSPLAQQQDANVDAIKHGAKLINLGFSGTTL